MNKTKFMEIFQIKQSRNFISFVNASDLSIPEMNYLRSTMYIQCIFLTNIVNTKNSKNMLYWEYKRLIQNKNQCQEQCQFSQVKFEVKAIFTWFSRKTQVVVFTLLYSFTLSIFLIFYEHAISAFKLSIALKFDVNTTRRWNIKCETKKSLQSMRTINVCIKI